MNRLYLIPIVMFLSTVFCVAQTTLTLQPGPSSGKDTYVYSLGTSNNYSTSTLLYSQTWTGGGTFTRRIFIEFDLSTVPEGAIVESASLYLYGVPSGNGHSYSGNSNTSWIERVTGEWEEGSLTWANQPGIDTTNRGEIPQESTYNADHVMNVTNLYQDIVNQPDTGRHGIRISLKTEAIYARLIYRSSEHTTDTTEAPKLVITYREPIWLGANTTNDGMIYRTGGVALGDTSYLPSNYLLSVDGNIICEEVTVKMSDDWPDFVYSDPDYELMSLQDLESYIMKYHYLPDIPSAQEIAEKGVNTSKMLRLQMEKIEQLTLYIIELEKRIQELEKQEKNNKEE